MTEHDETTRPTEADAGEPGEGQDRGQRESEGDAVLEDAERAAERWGVGEPAGVVGGSVGYTGGAAPGVGGAVGMRGVQGEEAARDRRTGDDPDADDPNMAQSDA